MKSDLTGFRSSQWLKIWEQKYSEESAKPLHVVDGFDSLSESQWSALVASFKPMIGPVAGLDVLEVGCGAGAFAQHFTECRSLSGIDYSGEAIKEISERMSGDFRVAEAALVPFADHSFDVVMCFSVFFYFDSFEYAEKALEEMVRVLRPCGVLFIGEVNDAAKQDLYHQVRVGENRGEKAVVKGSAPSHLFYDKVFFEEFAKRKGLAISIADEDTMKLEFYTSSQYRFSVRMS